jgi:hypothetical protein
MISRERRWLIALGVLSVGVAVVYKLQQRRRERAILNRPHAQRLLTGTAAQASAAIPNTHPTATLAMIGACLPSPCSRTHPDKTVLLGFAPQSAARGAAVGMRVGGGSPCTVLWLSGGWVTGTAEGLGFSRALSTERCAHACRSVRAGGRRQPGQASHAAGFCSSVRDRR